VKETYDQDLGCIRLTKRKHSKRISVRYDPEGRLKVSLPYRVSYKAGLHYVLSNKKLIREKIVDLQNEQYRHDLSHFHTRWHQVEVKYEKCETTSHQIQDGKVVVRVPEGSHQQDQEVQKAIRHALEEVLRKEARHYLPRRLNEMAEQFNLSYNNLHIKKAQSLWGSCSSINNINLNIHLMRLPDHLIDYVLAHELCHTLHKNHSQLFWRQLQQLLDQDVRKLRDELNQYSPKLY